MTTAIDKPSDLGAPPPVPAPAHAPSQLIALTLIKPSATNPRKYFDKDAHEELTASVQKHGVLQPVLVRPRPKDFFELVAGERRYRAAKAAGLAVIPALVRELADEEVLEIQVIENLQRQDLHPLEEAHGYHALLARKGYDVAKIAERVGRSTTYVYDRVKLLSLTKDAQDLFRAGRIQAGHAVLLARLKPEDQERAMDPNGRDALFQAEFTLFHPEKDGDGKASNDKWDGLKARSVKELAAWIDEHVRLDVEAPDLPELFPETAQVITKVEEQAEKLVSITHDHFIQPETRTNERVIGPKSWKRADEKSCDYAVTGVIVVGVGRGEAFKVCIEKKKCATHWGKEQRAAVQRAKEVTKGGKTGEDRYELQRRKEEEEQKREEAKRARFAKAVPAIVAALAVAVKKASATGILAELLEGEILRNRQAPKNPAVPRGKTAEDLVRYLAFQVLASRTQGYYAATEFPKTAKAFGIDVAKLVDEASPKEPAPAAPTDTKKPETSTKAKPAKAPKKKR
jgi:ParB/RepB/Spo0J family partition protein